MDTLIKKDLKYNWHPFTQMKDCQNLPPILIKRAKGIKLYDNRGKFYYDTISSWWCNIHGHGHPRIKTAIKKQLDSLEHVLFAGFTHRGAIELAQELVRITPKNLTKVFYSDNGSTSVESALKISFQYWQNIGKKKKKKFVSLDAGYHGDTIGGMSVSGVGTFNQVFKPLFFDSIKVSSPYCYRCPMKKERISCNIDCIKPLEKALKRNHREIAGMILEPLIMAAGGMIVYPKEYLEKVGALCKKYNIHLILDEVATGFGRTGKMFACQHTKVKPDFICLSKGITSGYLPFAATLTTEKIYKAFYADHNKNKTFFHGHTYTANPLGCAAALASLKIFKEEKTLQKVNRLMPYFYKELERFRDLPHVGDLRYLGMVGAIELVENKRTKKRFDPKQRIGLKIYRESLEQSLILRSLGDIIYLYLPLRVKKSELRLILNRTFSMIKKL
ncbi:adenosylmethionine--8-amino-7-oxononanoate transaminase [Candidatus Omnitrophota bacterium]